MDEGNQDLEKRLKAKQDLFDGLRDALKSDDEEPSDPGRQSSIRAMQKALDRKRELSKTDIRSNNKNSLTRSASESHLASSNMNATNKLRGLKAMGPSASDPNGQVRLTAMSRADSSDVAKGPPPLVPTSSSAATSKKTSSKRKRDSEIRLVPDDQQIFKSQHFYFFPNSDKHPARKLRIAKAIEFGATWESEFNESVTHIVADKSMDYALLLKYLKRDALPPHIALVSENYPAECITFRRLLDPRQPQFKVRGYDLSAYAPPVSSTSSDRSLRLKPAPDSVRARQPETPMRDDRVPQSPPTASTEDGEREEAHPRIIHSDKSSTPQIESTAEFDAALKQARDLRNVPLDMEEDSGSRPVSSDGPTTDDERPPAGLELDRRKNGKAENYQDKFQCMHKHTGSNENPNAGTVAILQQMAEYYNQVADEWRTRAYRKAISTLRNHPTKVWTREEALALPQIGGRLATKIGEIAYTNRLRRLDNAKAKPQDQVLQKFMQVYGAGFAQASKWVNAGYTDLDELLEKAELTPNQRIGTEHYADFNSRIPRAEVEQHGEAVRKALGKIDPTFEVIVGGSYRRGAKDSGDIDCIITRPNTDLPHIRQVVLDQLVPKLFAKNFLMAELAATSRDDGSKWHGASCISGSNSAGIWRRIDLLLVPSDEIGAALIYFTGNDIFNRSLRLLASTKGMRLNQRGLYKDVIRGKGREKLSEGTLVEGRDEKKIFEVLGVPWRPPEHRIC